MVGSSGFPVKISEISVRTKYSISVDSKYFRHSLLIEEDDEKEGFDIKKEEESEEAG